VYSGVGPIDHVTSASSIILEHALAELIRRADHEGVRLTAYLVYSSLAAFSRTSGTARLQPIETKGVEKAAIFPQIWLRGVRGRSASFESVEHTI
jgi:hypothetical protein